LFSEENDAGVERSFVGVELNDEEFVVEVIDAETYQVTLSTLAYY